MEDHKKPFDQSSDEMIQAVLSELHTIAIGQVVSFDEDTQRVNVQLVNKRKYVHQDEAKPISILEKVPVAYPGDGDHFLTFKPKKDTHCIILVSERNIDNWYEVGGVVDPQSARRFDFSDSLALVGINFKGSVFETMHEGIALRNREFTTFMQVVDKTVNVQAEETINVKGAKDINIQNDNGIMTLAENGEIDMNNGNLKVLV